MMPDAAQITEARNSLDLAIQQYMRDVHDSGIVVDWYLVAEVHKDDSGRLLLVAESPTMTAWKRNGLVRFIAQAIGNA